MTVAQRNAAPAGGGVRATLMRRYGGVPVWAYVAVILALLLIVAYWRARRTDATATAVATGDGTELPGDQAAPPVFIVPAGPAGPPGAPGAPGAPGIPGPAGPPATVPPAPPGGGRTTPPATVPAPKPTAPVGVTIPVVKWTKSNPPWASTLSGIFAHFKGKTTAKSWQEIWNHPANAALRKKRGAAERIQAGDKIFVPGVK